MGFFMDDLSTKNLNRALLFIILGPTILACAIFVVLIVGNLGNYFNARNALVREVKEVCDRIKHMKSRLESQTKYIKEAKETLKQAIRNNNKI